MSVTALLPLYQRDRILADASREQRRVVLTHHAPDGWSLYKGTFAASSDNATLVVQVPKVHLTQEPRVSVGDLLGCAFRDGHRKCICASTVEAVRTDHEFVTITLRRPEQLQQLQRRAFERAVPPPNTVVAVRFWREGAHGPSNPSERIVRHGQLVDISAGGMRVHVSDPSTIEMNVYYRCAFTPGPGRPAFVLDALLRHREAGEPGRTALGFQFVGLETTPDGRKTLDRLARLVSRFQRGRQRRSSALQPAARNTMTNRAPSLDRL